MLKKFYLLNLMLIVLESEQSTMNTITNSADEAIEDITFAGAITTNASGGYIENGVYDVRKVDGGGVM